MLARLMRFATFLSLVIVAGCGGHVAAQSSDAATPDAATDSNPSSDVSSCPELADACFAKFAAELARAEACMGHVDSCTASGESDASGCGVETFRPGGGYECNWPDGAHEDILPVKGGEGAGELVNARGDSCWRYEVSFGASSADTVEHFPDGATFLYSTPNATPDFVSIQCPDGSMSTLVSRHAFATCRIGLVCCSSTSPPTCPPRI